MADKVKKKPFFTLKRWNSQKMSEENSPQPLTPRVHPMDNSSLYRSSYVPSVGSKTPSILSEIKPKKLSMGGIQDLVQCALCLEVLHNPKMLPCQHTFCMACLSVYIADVPVINCPICRTRIHITGQNFIRDLPSNLYIDSLLQLVGIKNNSPTKSPDTPPVSNLAGMQSVDLFAAGVRCAHCKTMSDNIDMKNCQHCKLKFCRVCWSQHLEDMRTQLESILKQLDTATSRLEHKVEHYKNRCDRIAEQINIAADEKINAIIEVKENMLQKTADLQKSGDMSALALKTSLDEARTVAEKAMTATDFVNDDDKVLLFINLHQNTVQLLSDVSKWDTERFVFDQENFRIESDTATPLDAESDDPVLEAATRTNDPLESEENLVLHYRSRNFIPHYVWRKTSRPCGVGLSPWNNHLYICGMDSHSVLVVERTQAKIVTRLSCEEMLCPVHVSFMKSLGEIYVTDKWKHCIHVFSKDGDYMRSIGQKGSRVGMFRSPEGIATDNANHLIYVVDTGNDRVQVLQPDGKFIDQLGVVTKHQVTPTATAWETKEVICTELNAPTSVAVTNDRVVILDSGNRRVKVYNKQDKNKIVEFGSLGQRKGQFRQPEVLTVDPMGYILVGDSGNCRVQVFKPTGQLVRVFGGLGSQPGKFGWISGIHVTKQLDIIVNKWKHCIHVFSKDGDYMRSIGQKGSRVGMFRSPEGIATDNANHLIYVVDTGNDRVQVLQPDGKFIDQLGVVTKHQVTPTATAWETKEVICTELNAPTSVAVTNDRVVILDSGNRRVKVYNKQDKNKIVEFGSLGQRKGQFRQPEVLTVDPMGYILVGDSGNCRVQVFKPTGQLVRVFGGLGSQPGKFGWISGIHVTKQLDIIVSDSKNHCVNFFS